MCVAFSECSAIFVSNNIKTNLPHLQPARDTSVFCRSEATLFCHYLTKNLSTVGQRPEKGNYRVTTMSCIPTFSTYSFPFPLSLFPYLLGTSLCKKSIEQFLSPFDSSPKSLSDLLSNHWSILPRYQSTCTKFLCKSNKGQAGLSNGDKSCSIGFLQQVVSKKILHSTAQHCHPPTHTAENYCFRP